MATLNNPSEIAREALKLLLSKGMSPTPESYRFAYEEIEGLTEEKSRGFPDYALKDLLANLPRETDIQKNLVRYLQQATKERDWVAARNYLTWFVKTRTTEIDKNPAHDWRVLIANLLRQLDMSHKGVTLANKREMLNQVFTSSPNNEKLFERLHVLIKAWQSHSELSAPLEVLSDLSDAVPEQEERCDKYAEIAAQDEDALLTEAWRGLLLELLRIVQMFQLEDDPRLNAKCASVEQRLLNPEHLRVDDDLFLEVKRLVFYLEFVAEDRNELRRELVGLLQLVLDNVGELVLDDQWLHGQVSTVREAIAAPINLRVVTEARQRLKDIVVKQGQIKKSLVDAKESLRHLLAGFVSHVSGMLDSTSVYHNKMDACLMKVSQAEDINQLENVLFEITCETRGIQAYTRQIHEDMSRYQRCADEAQQRVINLQEELERVSTLVRHDTLTGALNRQGLDEMFDKEKSNALRRQRPLCLTLLDVDDFKLVNDNLGHDAGDEALIHLVNVIRQTMRPQDSVSRFGGEEFIIMSPDTSLAEGEKAISRLQRELTKRFFMHNNEKVLITFSAGLTDLRESDDFASIVKRADEAMYVAKRSGKNRVVLG